MRFTTIFLICSMLSLTGNLVELEASDEKNSSASTLSSFSSSASQPNLTVNKITSKLDFSCFVDLPPKSDIQQQKQQQQVQCLVCVCTLSAESKRAHLKTLKHRRLIGECLPANPESSQFSASFQSLIHFKEKLAETITLTDQPQEKEEKILCKPCECYVTNTSSARKAHENTDKHKKSTGQNFKKRKSNFDREVAIAEIKLAGFIVYTRNSFLFSRDFVPFLQNTFTDSNLLKKIRLSNSKATAIVVNILGPAQRKRLAEILKTTKFTVLIDESTDITTHKCLCIVVRYPDPDRGRICESLFDVVPIHDVNDVSITGTGEQIYNKMMASFTEAGIPHDNIMCFCSDTASVMMGEGKLSVFARLKAEIENIIKMKCRCHVLNLCAKDAAKKLPVVSQQFASVVNSYFVRSASRMNNWWALQIMCDLNPLRILKPMDIRWLSHYLSIRRLLKRWRALTIYFEAECKPENKNKKNDEDDITEHSPESILMFLKNPLMKLYHLFLYENLSKIIRCNEACQSEQSTVGINFDRLKKLYTDLLKVYMQTNYVENTNIYDINPKDTKYFKKSSEIDLGYHTEDYIRIEKKNKKFNENEEKEFRQACLDFLIEACDKLRNRCNFADQKLQHLRCFNANNCFNPEFHKKFYPTLDSVFEAFPGIFPLENKAFLLQLNLEWNNLINSKILDEIRNEKKMDVMWFKLQALKDSSGNYICALLAGCVLSLLCLPNSNAKSERVWSDYTLQKRKDRNRLGFRTIRAILLALQYIRDVGGIKSFIPTEDMINEMANGNTSLKKAKVENSESKPKSIVYRGVPVSEEYIKSLKMEDKIFTFKYPRRDQKDMEKMFRKEIYSSSDESDNSLEDGEEISEAKDCESLRDKLKAEFYPSSDLFNDDYEDPYHELYEDPDEEELQITKEQFMNLLLDSGVEFDLTNVEMYEEVLGYREGSICKTEDNNLESNQTMKIPESHMNVEESTSTEAEIIDPTIECKADTKKNRIEESVSQFQNDTVVNTSIPIDDYQRNMEIELQEIQKNKPGYCKILRSSVRLLANGRKRKGVTETEIEIKVNCAYGFHAHLTNGNPFTLDGIAKKLTNTCAFDSILALMSYSYENNTVFKEYIDENCNENGTFFSTITGYSNRTMNMNQVYCNRVSILLNYSQLDKKNKNKFDCHFNVTSLFNNLMKTQGSCKKNFVCSLNGCNGKRSETCRSLMVQVSRAKEIINDGADNVIEQCILSCFESVTLGCRKCHQMKAKSTVELGQFVAFDMDDVFHEIDIDDDFRDYVIRTDNLPIDFEVQGVQFLLSGFIVFVPGHYYAVCYHPGADKPYEIRDDIRTRSYFVQSFPEPLKISLLLYVIVPNDGDKKA